jgi:hypothetical protein
MTANKSFHGKGRPWVPPTITKLAIGTETKSFVAADQAIDTGTNSHGATVVAGAMVIVEPQPPSTPASKFGFSLEWSFPLSSRTD